jgi:putative hydrolase of HD superfamily
MNENEVTVKLGVDVNNMMTGSIHRMSHVYRYSSVPVIRRENVAEHSWYVAFYSLIIAKDLIRRGHEVDIGLLLERAMVHDLDESMTGDFLRGVKYGHPDLKRALDEISEREVLKMESDIGTKLLLSWSQAKSPTIEGDIVSVVDLARVLSYVFEEMKLGNMHVRDIPEECCGWIKKFMYARDASPVKEYAHEIYTWALERMRVINHGR